MHDLRHDPDAPETQHDPRSFEARMLEAAQRGVEGDDGQPRDTRTFPEMVVAEVTVVVAVAAVAVTAVAMVAAIRGVIRGLAAVATAAAMAPVMRGTTIMARTRVRGMARRLPQRPMLRGCLD